MKQRLTATLFVLVFAAGVFAFPTVRQSGRAAPAGWKKFTSTAGGFSVLMPADPKEEKETKNDGGPLSPYTNTLYIGRGENGAYLVGWTDYKPGVRLDVQGELRANRDNFLKGVNATLVAEKAIKLGTHPGIEFTGESEQAHFRVRVYVVGRRPYVLVALRPKAAAADPNADDFFSSFTLTP